MGRFARRGDPESVFAFAMLMRNVNRSVQFRAATSASSVDEIRSLLRLRLGTDDTASAKAPDVASMTEEERIAFYVKACKAAGFDQTAHPPAGMAVAKNVSE